MNVYEDLKDVPKALHNVYGGLKDVSETSSNVPGDSEDVPMTSWNVPGDPNDDDGGTSQQQNPLPELRTKKQRINRTRLPQRRSGEAQAPPPPEQPSAGHQRVGGPAVHCTRERCWRRGPMINIAAARKSDSR
ncbi:unnamed protein product [Heligmosomoides polygyrus]|uniref:Uncharacterized protein n=1 Tax=Heligmosomoides polygyrus TaxID=6339 RepID=A0A183FH34_HELPZ|nr:unnamed protein product [Heligmosomoides polygyrus]